MEFELVVLRSDAAVRHARGGKPTEPETEDHLHVSVSHHQEVRVRTDTKKPHLTILPGVGLVDLDDPKLSGALLERLSDTVGEELILFASPMKEGLLAASVAIGLEVMGELMQAEVSEVAGPKGRHNSAGRAAYRHGAEDGTVIMGGRKLGVRRPRVRTVEGAELHLDS